MRRVFFMVCLVAALATPGLMVRGQDRAQDVSTVVIPLAERESAAFTKAFNGHNFHELAGLFTSDADFEMLEGPNVEKLQYATARGREGILNSLKRFCSMAPTARLRRTVASARLIRPDVLISEADFEITGLPRDAGPIQGGLVTVRVMESGAWRIAAERGFSRTPIIENAVPPLDVSSAVVPLAERESAAFVKAFNGRNSKELAALFTSDADFAFLQGPSVEKLEYGMAHGKELIVSSIDMFWSTLPNSKLARTVRSARLIRPDMLISEADFEITGLPEDVGPIQGRAIAIRVLESGAWKITAERNFSRAPLGK